MVLNILLIFSIRIIIEAVIDINRVTNNSLTNVVHTFLKALRNCKHDNVCDLFVASAIFERAI